MGRLNGGIEAMLSPLSMISPDVGYSKPAIRRKRVVLPQPDGPRRVKNSFCRMATDASSTAENAYSPKPNTLETLRISIAFNPAICGPLVVADTAVPAFSAFG